MAVEPKYLSSYFAPEQTELTRSVLPSRDEKKSIPSSATSTSYVTSASYAAVTSASFANTTTKTVSSEVKEPSDKSKPEKSLSRSC